MAIRLETLPDLWNKLDPIPRRILLYLAKTTDWTTKGASATEIGAALAMTPAEVRRWIAPLEEAKLADKDDEKKTVRWNATRAAIIRDIEKGFHESRTLREALCDLGVIEPDATETVKARIHAEIPRALAIRIATLFPDHSYNDRPSGRAEFSSSNFGLALDAVLPQLLALPGAMQLLQTARDQQEADHEAYTAQHEADEAARLAWNEANPDKGSWWHEVDAPRKEAEKAEANLRESAAFRARIDAEAYHDPRPDRFD